MSDSDSKSASAPKPVRRGVPRRSMAVLPGLPSTPEPEAVAPAVAEAADLPTVPVSPPAAVPAVHAIEEVTMDAVNTTADTVNAAADTAADKGRALFADWNSRGKDALEKSTKAWDELGAFYRGNIEAMVESSRIAAKGFESFGQHAAELTRKSLEDATAAAKTMSQTKSPTEFMKLQGDLARSAFDAMVAETSRSTETMLKLAGDVAQPMASRLAVAADKMKTLG